MPYHEIDIKHFDEIYSDDDLYYCPDCDLYWESCECESCGDDELETFADYQGGLIDQWYDWKREMG